MNGGDNSTGPKYKRKNRRALKSSRQSVGSNLAQRPRGSVRSSNSPQGVQRLETELLSMSRSPFAEKLASFMDAGPNERQVKRWAKKNPDRWGQLIAIFARLTGYSEKVQVDNNILVKILHMSDSEVDQELAKLEGDFKDITPAD